jgi:alpha-1,2-mannosyltransferase
VVAARTAGIVFGAYVVLLLCRELAASPYPLDLHIYLLGGSALLHDHPLYASSVQAEGFGFTYPPFAALLFAPLSGLGATTALVIMTVLSFAGLTALVAYSVHRLPTVNLAWWQLWGAVVVIPELLRCEPVRVTLTNGQINLVLAGVIAWDLLGTGHGRWRGVGIGIATGIKLMPGVFILYLLVTRQWRSAGLAAGAFLGTALLTLVVRPQDSGTFWRHKLLGSSSIGDTARSGNQSLYGAAQRLVGKSTTMTALWLVAAALVLVLGLWVAVGLARRGEDVLALAVVGITSCLVSPVAWTHHWVWCIPAVLALFIRLRGPAVAAHAAVLCFMILFVIGCNKHPLDETFTSALGRATVENGYVIAGVVLLVVLGIQEFRRSGLAEFGFDVGPGTRRDEASVAGGHVERVDDRAGN